MKLIKKSDKLTHVCYEIRGPALEAANRLEDEGHRIIKLNIGNTAPFGLFAPDEIVLDMKANLTECEGYSDSKGLFSARKAIMQYCQQKNIRDVTIDNIYTGNGVSELIVMTMQGLLNPGDEVLVPMPDYPLWTAAVTLADGKAVHYLCDEAADWTPDIADMKKKITDKTKAIVVINPNNPTGALYPRELLEQIVELARQHDLVILADEIYDKVVYDGHVHTSIASLADDVFFITMNGLSKAYRVCGFRAGWMVMSGRTDAAPDFLEGIRLLSTMRLCSNVPGQSIIQTALGGHQSIQDLVVPGGRLYAQREVCYNLLSEIPGVSVVKPKAALYMFPKFDMKKFNLKDDVKFIYDLLIAEKILVVQGTGFNWPTPDHIRIVFLPRVDELKEAVGNIGRFLSSYKQ